MKVSKSAAQTTACTPALLLVADRVDVAIVNEWAKMHLVVAGCREDLRELTQAQRAALVAELKPKPDDFELRNFRGCGRISSGLPPTLLASPSKEEMELVNPAVGNATGRSVTDWCWISAEEMRW